jgi:hypothetical protein
MEFVNLYELRVFPITEHVTCATSIQRTVNLENVANSIGMTSQISYGQDYKASLKD